MIIKNDKLFKILEERAEVFKEVQKINEEMIKLDTERKKLAYKMDGLKEKTKKILDKEKIELDEFEIITNVGIKDGEIELTIVDEIEEYKKVVRERKEKENA